MTPTISVIIPTFNRGTAIEATIESVLRQTVPSQNIEILVVDDGSTDGTGEWLQNRYKAHPQIRLFRIPNGGVARARNFGLQESRGKYIAFCDHDDVWLPRKLELQIEALNVHPEAALVGCNWHDVDEEGQEWNDVTWRALYARWKPARGRVYDWVCASPCPIISMTLPLLRADCVREVGAFDPRCVPCDDWDLYLRLAHRFEFAWVEEPLAHYVHHSRQQSGDVAPLHAAMKRVLQKQWPAVLCHPKSVGFWWSFSRFLASSSYYYRAKAELEVGRKGSTWREIGRAGLRHPFAFGTKQWLYLMFRLAHGQFGPY